MLQPLLLIVGLIPLLFKLGPLILPETWLETYAYWDADTLNQTPGQEGRQAQWRNMGSWRNTEVYSEAARDLGTRLLTFADSKPGGRVLDLAHGAGESLVLHLTQDPPPVSLTALTSLEKETLRAMQLVDSAFDTLPLPCPLYWYTQSASFNPSSTTALNLAHPLNPMKGYLGDSNPRAEQADNSERFEDENEDEHQSDDDDEDQSDIPASREKGFDLVYILDSIYHFPPAIPHFLTTVISSLAPGGVVAYTDVLPPPDLSSFMGHWVLPTIVGVPTRNIVQRPKTLDEYRTQLHKIGYVEVEIEDWTLDVFPGFSRFLKSKAGAWPMVGRGVAWAEKRGWRYLAVRAKKAS